jgi:hypothetical protein
MGTTQFGLCWCGVRERPTGRQQHNWHASTQTTKIFSFFPPLLLVAFWQRFGIRPDSGKTPTNAILMCY